MSEPSPAAVRRQWLRIAHTFYEVAAFDNNPEEMDAVFRRALSYLLDYIPISVLDHLSADDFADALQQAAE